MQKEFEFIQKDLIRAYNSKGMKASGKFEESLEINVSKGNAKIEGSEYAVQLDEGRKPTSSGSSGGIKLIDQIKEWIKDKGIVSNIKNDNDNSTLAFLITRKIHRDGWNRSKHGGVGLISEVITASRIQSIINKIGASKADTLVLLLQKELKNII